MAYNYHDTSFHWFRPAVAQIKRLSPRQREVLLALGAGLSNRQIAAQLVITEHTVKIHLSRILEILSLDSRLQAGLVGFVYGGGREYVDEVIGS